MLTFSANVISLSSLSTRALPVTLGTAAAFAGVPLVADHAGLPLKIAKSTNAARSFTCGRSWSLRGSGWLKIWVSQDFQLGRVSHGARGRVPIDLLLAEVGLIRHMAGDGGMVSEDSIFNVGFARFHRFKEGPEMWLQVVPIVAGIDGLLG